MGQEVLVKRTFGPFPKANVRWLKGPYIVEKKIVPVNYHIVICWTKQVLKSVAS